MVTFVCICIGVPDIKCFLKIASDIRSLDQSEKRIFDVVTPCSIFVT